MPKKDKPEGILDKLKLLWEESAPGARDAMDPYVRVSIVGTRICQETLPVHQGGTDLVWTEEHDNLISIPLPPKFSDLIDPKIKIEVLDHEFGVDEVVGQHILNFADIHVGMGAQISELHLEHFDDDEEGAKGVGAGMLNAKVHFFPFVSTHGTLQVEVLSGQHLRDVEMYMPDSADVTQDKGTFLIATIMVVTYLVGGVIFYTHHEGWTMVDALYFSVITLVSIGYGDLVPTTAASQYFTSVYILVGIGGISAALSIVIAFMSADHSAKMKELTSGNKSAEEVPPQMRVLISFMKLMLLSLLGVTVMVLVEGWTVVDAVYWSIVTMTTVGYGDVTPKTMGGRLFVSVYALVAVLGTAKVLGQISQCFLESKQKELAQRILTQDLNLKLLQDLDEDGSGFVTEDEFLGKMLVKMGKVTQEHVELVNHRFDQIDVDGSGFLTNDDILAYAAEEAKSSDSTA